MVHIRYSTNFNQSDDTASRNACGSCFLWPSHLFHEFHLEFYYYTKELRTGQRSGTKNVIVRMGERGGKKRKSKIKIQDGFQVLVIVLNWNYLVFYLKKGISFTLSPKFFCSFAKSKSKIKLEIFLSSRFEKRIFKNSFRVLLHSIYNF